MFLEHFLYTRCCIMQTVIPRGSLLEDPKGLGWWNSSSHTPKKFKMGM